jgi:hypothetical protein
LLFYSISLKIVGLKYQSARELSQFYLNNNRYERKKNKR